MSETEVVANEHFENSKSLEPVGPEELVFDLYKAYELRVEPSLWPWETKRWHELVFCLLTTIAEPEISVETIREVTRSLSEWRLLDINVLASLGPTTKAPDASSPILVTIATILQQSGFESDKSRVAVEAICEAASGLKQNYDGKVQKYFRKYGSLMLEELAQSFSFTQLKNEDVERAFSIWLQNTLNMPVPASNPIADKVCENLKVEYSALVEAADKLDINVALLDDALRDYWERELEEKEFLPATQETE